MAKKSKIEMGTYLATESELKAMYWCVKENIKISPKAISTLKWEIVIELNGKPNISKDSFSKTEIWIKIFEYYKYYYEKYKK